MKLEVGKYYRTRDGRKVGPMKDDGSGTVHPWCSERGNYHYYPDGRSCIGVSCDDLIAEWTDNTGPVRTVTTTQIIPGQYGCVKVHDPGSEYVRINVDAAMDVDELTDAIATLTAIRDAMQANTTA